MSYGTFPSRLASEAAAVRAVRAIPGKAAPKGQTFQAVYRLCAFFDLKGHTHRSGRAYKVRYTHKIAPSTKDVGPKVRLTATELADRKALGKALRNAGVLAHGGRVKDYCINYTAGRATNVCVFPSVPGLTTYWHSITLEV